MNYLRELCTEGITQITIEVVAMIKDIEIMKENFEEVRRRMDNVDSGITIRIDTIEATMAEQYNITGDRPL